MANNPAFGALTPRMSGTLRSDSQNVEAVNKSRKHNMFGLEHAFYSTNRFGEVRPFFHDRFIDQDHARLSSKHDLWTLTLQSPLLSDLRMYKDYFYVPYKCILPNSWDVFKNQPVQGDDVPQDVYTRFPLNKVVYQLYSFMRSYYDKFDTLRTDLRYCALFWRCWYLFNRIMSTDSLLNSLGIDSQRLFPVKASFMATKEYQHKYSFDSDIIDSLNPFFGQVELQVSGQVTTFNLGEEADVSQYRLMISYIERYFDTFEVFSFDSDLFGPALGAFLDLFESVYDLTGDNIKPKYLDLSELYAYQLTGAQFYVNDNVDTVFTSKNWLDNLGSLMYDAGVPIWTNNTFDYNGSTYLYDILSEHHINLCVDKYDDLTSGDIGTWDMSQTNGIMFIWFTLFTPFESMRYGDYFTGSRLAPLAVGADEKAVAPVVGEGVQAVDITKSVAWQSFLNDIMKLGPVSWIQQNGIYGDFPVSLDPMPRFISRQLVNIGEMTIEDNANDVGNIVSRMRSGNTNYAFECDIKEDSIILGLCSFDIPRIYQNVNSRFIFTKDRHDFFNPYFQNIGDQPIYTAEKNLSECPIETAVDSETENGDAFDVFSWTNRDTEFKQRVNRAVGGFVGSSILPSWAFIDDFSDQKNLTPYFLRNHNFEFDRFYKALSNISFAGYFHFYIRWYNDAQYSRAMQYRPSIQMPQIHQ